MKEKVTVTVNLSMKNYVDIQNLIGFCKINNLALNTGLPTTDEELINAALFNYLDKIETIVSYYKIEKRAQKVDEELKVKNRFKEILQMVGMKQKELAELTGIDNATISFILTNRNQPSIEYFLRIWTVLGCPPVEDVFYRERG